jgi:two-component system, chemotaxis family, protein-glutamate methylesterase/glutaminase
VPSKIKVLIVDDSALVRRLLRDIMTDDPGLEVIGTASNGIEAIRMVTELDPDVVTMDIHMPEMDGLTALEYIMKKSPRPVIMLSALAQKGAIPTIKSLELGAVDFIAKPSHFPSAVKEVREEVLEKVRMAASSRGFVEKGLPASSSRRKLKLRLSATPREKLVVIGASAGGPKALADIMPMFPPNLPAAMLIVQHMPGVFTRSFAERLDSKCELPVKEAEQGDLLEAGKVLVAPGGYDLLLAASQKKRGMEVRLVESQAKYGATPHIDSTLEAAAEAYLENSVGVIMTGMGSDGAKGTAAIKGKQGKTVAQSEETCLVFGMPKAAIETRCVDWVVPLEQIPETILSLL